jgi:UDP-N-acetylglucosamine 2-epimerase (non-hydrolysing)
MKIAVILGTRPEIIKMAPVIKELESNNLDLFVLHTGQHYTYQMDAVFFEQLELHQPEYNLDIGSGSHAESTGKMLIGIEQILQNESPGIILVEGDTNSILAGALAAAKLGIKVGHIEAGLRSYDRNMPEEINRILADHISDFLFAPTQQAKQILLREGISEDKVFVTGNTVVDAVFENLELARSKTNILDTRDLKSEKYFLVTLHRQENVDNRERFSSVLEGLQKVSVEFGMPVYYPIHPRAKKMMADFSLNTDNIFFIDPVDYLDFLQLESNARLILTDSGGVQEESCVLQVPCVTLRDNTERPETIEVGANMLAGTQPDSIVQCVRKMLSRKNDWQNPFGDGNAAKRIVNLIMEAGYG